MSKEIYRKTLNEMPDFFSGKEFCEKLRELGISEYEISTHAYLRFLKKNTDKHLQRSYKKKTFEINKVDIDKKIETMLWAIIETHEATINALKQLDAFYATKEGGANG